MDKHRGRVGETHRGPRAAHQHQAGSPTFLPTLGAHGSLHPLRSQVRKWGWNPNYPKGSRQRGTAGWAG